MVVDERLFHAHDLARAALREVTPESTIGEAAGYVVEDGGVVSLRFANRMDGYPGWFWTVSVAVVEGAEPTVLEVELLPGDGALLAPEWLPWAERLAEYQAAQAAAGEDDESEDDEDDDASDEDEDDAEDADDLDAADFDSDGSPILHAGDVDGVDIDELDDTAADAEQTADDAEPDDDDESVDEGDDEDDESRESLREY
ncbi:DNA primase [Microbacterium oleivorans]|uniref:DNA primase n=1 Tax=Microbacterium oleivorans TaxID=273677 RepID=A0A177KEU2_9MICO|nr:DNA primase [Microbacterium oleivorans]